MARSKVVPGETLESGGTAVMEQGQSDNGKQASGVPTWFPSTLPEDEEELAALAARLDQTIVVPRGARLFVKAIHQVQHHRPLHEQAQQRLVRTWDYMHGRMTPGVVTGARKRSMKSRAQKFYEALSEGALRRHCAMHELDYDTLKEEGQVIEKLIEAAATLV